MCALVFCGSLQCIGGVECMLTSSVHFASEGCVFPTTVLTIYSRMQTQTLEKSWIVPAIQRWGGIYFHQAYQRIA